MQEPSTTTNTQVYRYLSRDLSWLKFNERVLDQAMRPENPLLKQLKFLSISASNLDEFFMVRVGNLYNYIDCKKKWVDHLGLREVPFRNILLAHTRTFFQKQHNYFLQKLLPQCPTLGCTIVRDIADLDEAAQTQLRTYFQQELLPVLTSATPGHCSTSFEVVNKALVLGLVTRAVSDNEPIDKQILFIQLPETLPRFYSLRRHTGHSFIAVEAIIQAHLPLLFNNISILSSTLFRVIRNGDFSLDEIGDLESDFWEPLKHKLKTRDHGRVVRIEVEEHHDPWLLQKLQNQWDIDEDNVFVVPSPSLVDLTGLELLLQEEALQSQLPSTPAPILPTFYPKKGSNNIFDLLKQQDILLHHPYNSINIVIDLLERAASDPHVSTIKITIYRLAQASAIVAALLKANKNKKHVVVLLEVKARFDEARNIRELKRLEEAGCTVICSLPNVKVHAKMMMIVRKEGANTVRYVHIASGNYNEETARGYADISLMTANESYADDVAAFFDVVNGKHASHMYTHLITTPLNLREQIIAMIDQEAYHAQQGLPAGIVIKVNALEDEMAIEALYRASQAGVPIQLIVRGICCLIPGRPGLSEHIVVRSIVGDFLEHARIYYFHAGGQPKVYGGSADMMVRNFEKRIEALFAIESNYPRQQVMHLLACNLRDNVNAYLMQEDGSYVKQQPGEAAPFNMYEAFFKVTPEEVLQTKLFT